MSKAAHILAETDNSVGAVSEKCGYSNTENFIRAFRKAFGITPLACRRKASQSPEG